jgi:hypothetical protein
LGGGGGITLRKPYPPPLHHSCILEFQSHLFSL